MGYYMRFLIEDDRPITLDLIESALKQVDSAYHLAARVDDQEFSDLMLGADVYGELEINRRSSDLMEEEMSELRDEIADAEDEAAKRVSALLSTARAMVVVRVLSQGRTSEATLDKISPLWEWLFREHRGLLYADGEGYYDVNGEVLMVE